MDSVERIARSVLYEGYVLWPYRRSSRKNQQRWTFGGVFPRRFSETRNSNDPWLMQTQCLVVGARPEVTVQVRFLQVVERVVNRKNADGSLEAVDGFRIGSERYLAWDEATERDVVIEKVSVHDSNQPVSRVIDIAAGQHHEPITGSDGIEAGEIVRKWRAIEGAVELRSEPVHDEVFRLTVTITNTTPWDGLDRESTLRQTFVSTHTILKVMNGEFVSLADPPATLATLAEGCHNIRTWPVLAGTAGDRTAMLSSPIILYDYPQIAPESPGDLYDGTEIDQLLLLNILTLTDDEKEEMRASDPRAREILERSESLTADDFMSLHGVIRDFRAIGGYVDMDSEVADVTSGFVELEKPAPTSVVVDGIELRKGSRVRLRPHPGGDIFDIVLAGKTAYIESIEQDYEGRIHLSVTIEDDPGRELGEERVLGHRFFYAVDEVEPLAD